VFVAGCAAPRFVEGVGVFHLPQELDVGGDGGVGVGQGRAGGGERGGGGEGFGVGEGFGEKVRFGGLGVRGFFFAQVVHVRLEVGAGGPGARVSGFGAWDGLDGVGAGTAGFEGGARGDGFVLCREELEGAVSGDGRGPWGFCEDASAWCVYFRRGVRAWDTG